MTTYCPRSPLTWVVVNQSHSPSFQRMLVRLSEDLGPCLFLTGSPHGGNTGALTVECGPGYDRRGIAHRAVSWLRFLAFASARLATVKGRPFVLVVTNPPMLPHLAWAIRRVRDIPYGLLIWDVYPDHIVSLGWAKSGNLGVLAWRLLNRLALIDARKVITLGDHMAGALQDQVGNLEQLAPIEVIPNWVDTDSIRPVAKDTNTFAIAHGQVERLTVLYSGNMGATHDLRAIVDAAERLRNEPILSFLFIGNGLGRTELQANVVARGLPNTAFLDLQPWDVLPLSLATGDIAVVTQSLGTEALSVPSKTYSALAAGCAILAITDPKSDLGRLVSENELGVVCPHGNTDAVVSAIHGFVRDPVWLAECRARARQLAVREFSENAVLSRLRTTLRAAIVSDR